MSKRVKNPCKICYQSVNLKSGIQCQGACQTWIHYNCLNYTPGRIKDIKSGIIRVTCPCPDCKSIFPKEYRTDKPYSCANNQCPANGPPICTNVTCPTNSERSKQNQTSRSDICPKQKCAKDICKENRVIDSCFDTPITHMVSPEQSGDVERLPDISMEVEKMCNTVGQLTNQINELMNKMKQAVKQNGGNMGGMPKSINKVCVQTGDRSHCPKPCFCPGNPGVRTLK